MLNHGKIYIEKENEKLIPFHSIFIYLNVKKKLQNMTFLIGKNEMSAWLGQGNNIN